MTSRTPGEKTVLVVLAAGCALFLLHRYLFYFRNPVVLAGMILFEIVLISLWHYETVFLPLLFAIFIWSGTDITFAYYVGGARWPVLAIGAIAGAALWMRSRRQALSPVHLAALFTAIAALVSSLVSQDRSGALLKVCSLFLLFLYGSTGARLAIAGREVDFVHALVGTSETIVFFSAFATAIGWPLWGNPNSFGAAMCVCMPILVWGMLVAETEYQKYRRGLAVLTCAGLLYIALSRASILAAAVSVVALCLCLRRHRLLMGGALVAVLLVGLGGVLEPTHFEQFTHQLTDSLLYKGKKQQGVFGSRESTWDSTVASLKVHPWFGTGWGTSDMGGQAKVAMMSVSGGVYTVDGTNREHGCSYLAMAEYLGLLGTLPLAFLLLLVAGMVLRVCVWMRRTSNPRHCAIPIAMAILAGLVHAFFEDWMVAPGSYLCVFFWTNVFLLNDLMPAPQGIRLRAASPAHPHVQASPAGALALNQ